MNKKRLIRQLMLAGVTGILAATITVALGDYLLFGEVSVKALIQDLEINTIVSLMLVTTAYVSFNIVDTSI